MIALAGCAARSSAPVATIGSSGAPVQVCIVDTIAPGGMMTVSAIRDTLTNDTTVLQSSGRMPIAKVVAGPSVWNKQPLQLTTSAGKVRYAASGKTRVFEPGKIMLLGMVKNTPVFAGPKEVAPMRPEIEALAATGSDLEQALQKRPALRRRMNAIRTVYVPTSLVNCTFQTLTRPATRRR